MEALFWKLTELGMAAGWLVLAVAVLRPVLKKSPKWMFCILWGLVALRLLCPFTVESPFSLLPAENALPAAPQVTFSWVETPPPTVSPPAVTPVLPTAPVNPLPFLWLAGTAVMLAYAGIRYLGIRRRIREAVPAGDGIFLCDRVTSPFLLGLCKPRVYLPSGLAEGDRIYVLAHEQAHFKRGDQFWKPLGFFLLAVYWFQPLLWLGYLLFCRDLELACDERVIREMGSPWKKPYSQALINCSAPSRLAVYPLAFGEVGVKERVKNILTYRKANFWILLVTVAAIAVTGVCFLTNPVQASPADGTQVSEPADATPSEPDEGEVSESTEDKFVDRDEDEVSDPTEDNFVDQSDPEEPPQPQNMCWPVQGGYITCPFGVHNHDGIDYALRAGAPIVAAADGTVVHAGWYEAGGLTVILQHPDGIQTQYSHCEALTVTVGQQVSQEQQIAAVGSTGRSTGPHLHFAVLVNGQAVDPLEYLPSNYLP